MIFYKYSLDNLDKCLDWNFFWFSHFEISVCFSPSVAHPARYRRGLGFDGEILGAGDLQISARWARGSLLLTGQCQQPWQTLLQRKHEKTQNTQSIRKIMNKVFYLINWVMKLNKIIPSLMKKYSYPPKNGNKCISKFLMKQFKRDLTFKSKLYIWKRNME